MRSAISLEPTAPSDMDQLTDEVRSLEMRRRIVTDSLLRASREHAAAEAQRCAVTSDLAKLRAEGRHRDCGALQRELSGLDTGPRGVEAERLDSELRTLDQRIGELRRQISHTPCV